MSSSSSGSVTPPPLANKWPFQAGSAGTVAPFAGEWAPQIVRGTGSFTRYDQARPTSAVPYRGRGRGTRNTSTRTLPILMDLPTAPPTPRPQKTLSPDLRLLSPPTSSSSPRTSRPFAAPSVVNPTYSSPLHPSHQVRSSPSLPAATRLHRSSPTHRAATAPPFTPLHAGAQQLQEYHLETTDDSATVNRSPQPQKQHRQEAAGELATMNRSQPILKNDEWWRNSDVLATIGPNLSDKVQLKDIYSELKDKGVIEKIDILLDNAEYRTGLAKVKFSTVTSPFWESGTIDCGGYGPVHVTVRPSYNRPVASLVNPSKVFPERMKLEAKSLEFGFMLQPNEFMVMYTTNSKTRVTWEVNFTKRKIGLTFTCLMGPGDSGPRSEKYMLEIPFTLVEQLFVPAEEDPDSSQRIFVICLPDPPKFYRELKDWTKSMKEKGQTRWITQDVWMRQTDIELDMRAREKRPMGLRHNKPIVDIGRWTTYRLCFEFEDNKPFDRMIDILKDFNVRLKPLKEFEVRYDKTSLTPVWNYIDHTPATSHSELLQNLTRLLSFPVRYQLEVCISHGWLNENNLTPTFIDRLGNLSERSAIILLENVDQKKKRVFEPMEIFLMPKTKGVNSPSEIPDHCVKMRRATVTPTNILLNTPSVEISNRVIRHYDQYVDRFIRVNFTDEKMHGRIRFTDRLTSNELFTRVFRTLDQGIVIGDRHYEFLAFGNSQLREHGAYFFAPNDEVKVSTIREWMGVFTDIRVVAKHASRLGQCFSTTRAFKSCNVNCVVIKDVERHGFCFTDGVGKMSPVVARLLAEEVLKPKRQSSSSYQASCFQFRLGGCKGVLAVDPNVQGLDLHMRPSQRKFWSPQNKLEIIRCSQFASASLNRQLIQVMSSLGVDDEFFCKRLGDMLKDYHLAVSVQQKALDLLTKQIDPNQMTLAIANLVSGGFMTSREPFVMSLLHLWRAWTIKYLKEKAKITLENSAFLLGVVDETATLRGYLVDDNPEDLSQIFVQVSDPATGEFRVITGRCIVARNPSLHPGDVRVVEAVDVPGLHHLVDVVVFPQTGDRDIPSMLSGGDLDGDDYVVIWDEELTSQITNEAPASYDGQSAIELDRNVVIRDIACFFVQYMKNDRLGAIANAHLAWSDRLPDGVRSSQCIELAQLHSDAVDYPKTGVRANMKRRHRVKEWPHFFEKPVEEGVYRSEKILGQLYDMVERVDFVPCYDLSFNSTIKQLFSFDAEELQRTRLTKREYDVALRRIMVQHEITTEFEVWSTFVMHHGSSNDYKFHEEIGEISFSLKERFRKLILGECKDKKYDLPRKVAAMYVVTAQDIMESKARLQKKREKKAPRTAAGMFPPAQQQVHKEDIDKLPLMSFPWVFPDILIDLAHKRIAVHPRYGGAEQLDAGDDEMEEISIESLVEGDVPEFFSID